jgi:hypothetical protein
MRNMNDVMCRRGTVWGVTLGVLVSMGVFVPQTYLYADEGGVSVVPVEPVDPVEEQTITHDDLVERRVGMPDFILTATASSGLPVRVTVSPAPPGRPRPTPKPTPRPPLVFS